MASNPQFEIQDAIDEIRKLGQAMDLLRPSDAVALAPALRNRAYQLIDVTHAYEKWIENA